MSALAPTVAALLEHPEPAALRGKAIGSLDDFHLDAPANGGVLLTPIDLQCVKAAGVTFATSAIERVIEEKARGDTRAAAGIREELTERIGTNMRAGKPGSPDAVKLKQVLVEEGLWSQYLEVAIGPDAEIFTKVPVLATVGWGAEIGIRSDSTWNNPEPEIVLVADSRGRAHGATLGNDINLRDFEGRSALLLSKAKDNNASCAVGPFIRLFDDNFTMDDVRTAEVDLEIVGRDDGYRLNDRSSMREISRDPEELLRQARSEHQYPDGYVLFLGTLFAPVKDRDEPGRGFTHKAGDIVRISTSRLGTLVNVVTTSKQAPAWTFGLLALMDNLAKRGLLSEPAAIT
jgi:fumarylacetoacetate (FAA) hydrolase family protein